MEQIALKLCVYVKSNFIYEVEIRSTTGEESAVKTILRHRAGLCATAWNRPVWQNIEKLWVYEDMMVAEWVYGNSETEKACGGQIKFTEILWELAAFGFYVDVAGSDCNEFASLVSVIVSKLSQCEKRDIDPTILYTVFF